MMVEEFVIESPSDLKRLFLEFVRKAELANGVVLAGKDLIDIMKLDDDYAFNFLKGTKVEQLCD